MRSLSQWLEHMRFEIHAYEVEVRVLNPPGYHGVLRHDVSIAWSPEKLEGQIAAAVRTVQQARPGEEVRVKLHLFGDRMRFLRITPQEAA